MFIGVLTYINIWYDQQILLQNGQLTAPSVLLTIDSVFLKHYLRDTLSHLRDVGHMTYCAIRLNFLYFRRSTSIHNLIYTKCTTLYVHFIRKKIAVICFPCRDSSVFRIIWCLRKWPIQQDRQKIKRLIYLRCMVPILVKTFF